jgi:hypothetical protein
MLKYIYNTSTPTVDSRKGMYKGINNRQNTLHFRTIYYKCILTQLASNLYFKEIKPD